MESLRDFSIRYRIEHGYSQEYLAKLLGVSINIVSRVEKGVGCTRKNELRYGKIGYKASFESIDTLADFLLKFRLKNHVSQLELGKRLGISQRCVSLLERGDVKCISAKILQRVKALGFVPHVKCDSSFSSLVKRTRIESGLTQKELAEFIGVAPTTINNIEHGRKMSQRVERRLMNYVVENSKNRLGSISKEEIINKISSSLNDLQFDKLLFVLQFVNSLKEE